MELKRVVVTGMGAITPLGKSVPEYWDGLINGVSGADTIKQFDITKFKNKFACEVKDFEPTNYLERKEARKIDRFTQFALIASDQAVKDAGISKENVDVDRVGVIFASGIGGIATFQDDVMEFARGDGRSEEHTSELQSLRHLVCRLLLEKKKKKKKAEKKNKKNKSEKTKNLI